MAEQQKPRREYARIYRNVLATLLLLAVTPLVALGWFAINRIDAMHAEKISSGIEALTMSKVRAIDTFFTERIAQVRNLAQTHSFGELADPARLSAIFSVRSSTSASSASTAATSPTSAPTTSRTPTTMRPPGSTRPCTAACT